MFFLTFSGSVLSQSSHQASPSLVQAPSTSASSYNPSDFENVNLFNGKLSVKINLASMAARGNVDYNMNVTLNTAGAWDVRSINQTGTSYALPTWSPYLNEIPGKENERYAPGKIEIISYYDYYYGGPNGGLCMKNVTYRPLLILPGGENIEFKDTLTDGRVFTEDSCYTAMPYPNRGREFISFSGSKTVKLIFDSNAPIGDPFDTPINGFVLFSDGTKYRIDKSRVKWIVDKNGNKTVFTYESIDNSPYPPTETKKLLSIADSNGHQITIDYNVQDSQYGLSDKITQKGVGGVYRYTYISRKNLSAALMPSDTLRPCSQVFPELSSSNAPCIDAPVLSDIWLPGGKHYKFLYNSHGDIVRVELPAGGAVEYSSSGINGSSGYISSGIYRRLNERRLYKEGNSQVDKTNFEYTEVVDTVHPENVTSTNTVTQYEGNGQIILSKAKHYFYGGPNVIMWGGGTSPSGADRGGYNTWNQGREYKVDWFLNSSTILQKQEYTWQQRAPVSWYTNSAATSPPNDPRIIEVKTTLIDTNQVSAKTYTFDNLNNTTDVCEYDWGIGVTGSFLRRSHIDYINSTSYLNPIAGIYLSSLQSQNWISSDLSGYNISSLTKYEYDNYTYVTNSEGVIVSNTLIDRANVVGHDVVYDTVFVTRGNITKVTSYENALSQSGEVLSYSLYDILGNIVKTVDPRGKTTTISYNDNFGSPDGEARTNYTGNLPLNNQNTFAFATSLTNALGFVNYVQFDYFSGVVVNTENINGIISKTLYDDALDRPTQSFIAIGTPSEIQSKTLYDDANNRIQETSDLNTLNDNLIKWESFYDGLGRTIESRKYESNGSYTTTKSVPLTVAQDPETLQWLPATKVSNPYRTGEQPVWTTKLSDSMGRITKVIATDGAIGKGTYSGASVTVIDPAGKQGRAISNALGQLIRVDEPNEQGQLDINGIPTQSTNYSYDTLDNVTGISQGIQTRTFQYDSLSKLKQLTNPEFGNIVNGTFVSGTINYQYDKNGNLTQKIDPRGVQTVYTYDALNRNTAQNYSAPLNLPNYQTTPDVTYTYEDAAIPFSKGKLTKVTSSVSEIRYTTFDNLGKVLSSQQFTNGQTFNSAYTYNLSGILIEQTYPSGRVVKNVLDNVGELSIVQSKKNQNAGFWNYANHFAYTSAGKISSMQLGNGKWESAQFNSSFQPTQIALGTTQGVTNLLKLNYTYGATQNNGNVQSQTITVPTDGANQGFTATQTYTYDSLNRLKQAAEIIPNQAGWQQTFLYDRYGNRRFDTSNNNTTTLDPNCQTIVCNPEINTQNNRLIGYQFDNSGNLTIDAQNKKFSYNAENKQVKVETLNLAGNVVAINGEYFYDGDGKRVKKIEYDNAQIKETTIFAYDISGKLLAEYSTTPVQTAQVNYLTNDYLGSPRINTNQNGTVTARHDYQPFGEEIGRTNYGTDDVRNKFTSYEKDKETDLDFAQNRYYSSKHGRFTTPDPMTASAQALEPQSLNRFVYVRNNPIRLTDPSGLCPPEDDTPCDENGNPITAGTFTVTINTHLVGVEKSPGTAHKDNRWWGQKAWDWVVDEAKDFTGFDRGTGPTVPSPPSSTKPGDTGAGDSAGGSKGGAGGSLTKEALLLLLYQVLKHKVTKIIKGEDNRVRIQAQGRRPRVEKSEKANTSAPITKSEGITLLDNLFWNQLTPAERAERNEAYEKAKKWILNCPATGCTPPSFSGSKTFQNRNPRDSQARIDVEIRAGRAFVDDP